MIWRQQCPHALSTHIRSRRSKWSWKRRTRISRTRSNRFSDECPSRHSAGFPLFQHKERASSWPLCRPLDFTLFQQLDHGAIVTALVGRPCRATTYVFGNALIAVEMTRHVARAGLYVPLRLFVEAIDEDRVRITYDLPSSLMAEFGSPEVNDVARGLDEKVTRILDETSKIADQGRRG